MTIVYLVRHTEFENPEGLVAGRMPLQLSEIGIMNAQKLNKYFSNKDISKIYSSFVERCKQTAEIISGGKIPIEYDLRILESFTARQGTKGEGGFDHFGYRHVLGGEDYKVIQKRMVDFWENTNWEEGKNYIICSHGDPLYLLYQHLAGHKRVNDFNLGEPPPVFRNDQPKGSIRPIAMCDGKLDIGDILEVSVL